MDNLENEIAKLIENGTLPVGLDVALVLGILLCIFAIFAIVALITLLAYMRLFKKAGRSPLWVFVPFYGEYLMYKLVWNGAIFWVALGLSVLSALLPIFAIPLVVLSIILNFKMAFAYGKGVLFGFGLLFFPWLFLLILAFGRSEYVRD